MDFHGLEQPMDLLVKTNTDGSQVTRKLSHDYTRQMEIFKKMTKAEKKLFAVKHAKYLHRCVSHILKKN